MRSCFALRTNESERGSHFDLVRCHEARVYFQHIHCFQISRVYGAVLRRAGWEVLLDEDYLSV